MHMRGRHLVFDWDALLAKNQHSRLEMIENDCRFASYGRYY